jgi:hypothetical protein
VKRKKMKKIAIAWCVGILVCIIVVSVMLPTVAARTSISISRAVGGSGLQDESTEIRTRGNLAGGIQADLTARGSGNASSSETYEVTTGSDENMDTDLKASREYGIITSHGNTYNQLYRGGQTFRNYNVGSLISNEYEDGYIIEEIDVLSKSTKNVTDVGIESHVNGTAIDRLLVKDPISWTTIMRSKNEYKGDWTRELSYLIRYTREYGDRAGWLSCP